MNSWHETIGVRFTGGVIRQMDTAGDFYDFVYDCLNRYIHKDWGDTAKADWPLNDEAVEKYNDRIVAKYDNPTYGDIFIITEYDRSITTVLFTDEY